MSYSRWDCQGTTRMMGANARPLPVSRNAIPTNSKVGRHAFTVLMVDRLPNNWLASIAGFNSVAMEWFHYS